LKILGFNITKSNILNPSTYERDNQGNWWLGSTTLNNTELLQSVIQQLEAYNTCPWLSVLIQKKFNYFQNKVAFVVNNKGEDVSQSKEAQNILNLLKNPNPYQTGEQFETQLYLFQQLFGKAYIFRPLVGFTQLPSKMYVVPNWLITETRKVNVFDYSQKVELIEGYSFKINGKQYDNISPSDIEILHDSTINTIMNDYSFESQSRITTLYEAISNITAALEARGVLIKSRGALGIISPDSKIDVGNAAKLSTDEQTELQDKFRSLYGLAKKQWQFIFASKPLKFVKFNISPDELKLFEEIEDSVRLLSQAYGIDIKILGFESKFQNMGEAEKALYQNTIIPEANRIASFYNRMFKLKLIELKYDYSHVQVLQQSEQDKSQAFSNTTTSIMNIISNQTINEYSKEFMLVNYLGISSDEAKKLIQNKQVL